MPSKFFICRDKQQILIEDCLKINGCRMGERCATVPYLKDVAFDREFKGVSPSSAGNGARYIYLKAITDYAIDPYDRTWVEIGTAVHRKLSALKLVTNVLSEEKLSDEQMEGIADLLEIDESNPRYHILTDYKCTGSYKITKYLGITQTQEPILNEDGTPVLLKSGKNKGKPKTISVSKTDPEKADLKNETYQINRYRCFLENSGFPISKMRIQAIPRDGATYIAKSRGITENLYIIPIKRLNDVDVLYFYAELQHLVSKAFETKWAPRCTPEENWEGRRCENFCEISDACKEMDRKGHPIQP